MNIYHISEDLFESAQMSWEELTALYRDFCDNKYQGYQDILDAFIRDYLKDTARIKVHSIRYRVKDAEHLLAKIIRKKQNNHKKYRDLDKTNYEKFITDLIGIRCLVLFKEDGKSCRRPPASPRRRGRAAPKVPGRPAPNGASEARIRPSSLRRGIV